MIKLNHDKHTINMGYGIGVCMSVCKAYCYMVEFGKTSARTSFAIFLCQIQIIFFLN